MFFVEGFAPTLPTSNWKAKTGHLSFIFLGWFQSISFERVSPFMNLGRTRESAPASQLVAQRLPKREIPNPHNRLPPLKCWRKPVQFWNKSRTHLPISPNSRLSLYQTTHLPTHQRCQSKAEHRAPYHQAISRSQIYRWLVRIGASNHLVKREWEIQVLM